MKLKIAFAGIRHSHIFALYDKVMKNPDLEVAAVCEEDPEHSLLKDRPDIRLTHTSLAEMLKTVPCDIVAVGDYYAKRGSIVAAALKAGKHVISDKPLCISLKELDEIEKLAAQTGKKVGCMYELRSIASFCRAKEFIESGKLGTIKQIQFSGQHPLNKGTRPSWYFEAGKHGGTISDIASHAIDVIPWMTGLAVKRVIAARCWQAFASEEDHIEDAAQFMFELENGCGVMGDVSYSAPAKTAYTVPTYWRFNIWGTEGMIEFNFNGNEKVRCYMKGSASPEELPFPEHEYMDYLDSLLADIAGKEPDLNTQKVFESTRRVLELQSAAIR